MYTCLFTITKGVKLVGAVGARAPTLFLPRPEFAPIWVKKVGFQGPNPPRKDNRGYSIQA